MRRFSITVISFLLSCSQGISQKEYLDEVFAIIEKNSINKTTVDFKKIKADAYAKLDGVQSIEGCYPIVRSILVDLNDHHSFFMDKESAKNWVSTSKSTKIEVGGPFSGKLIAGDIGYIQMLGFSSGDSVSITDYANTLQGLIKSIDNKKIKGWILDLRYNDGGNCWPMLAGIGPLLGNGVCGYFANNDSTKSAWFYKDGTSGIDSGVIAKVSVKPYKLIHERNPIAVLTGGRTASSGEVVVTSFRKLPNARSFGEATAGLSTANAAFPLSDGSQIFLTTSRYADREGNVFGQEIVPDNVLKFTFESQYDTDKDDVVKAARNWIYKQ